MFDAPVFDGDGPPRARFVEYIVDMLAPLDATARRIGRIKGMFHVNECRCTA